MIENYYTPEQLESFRKRREADPEGTEKLARQGQADWAELMAQYTAEMQKGTDPADPRVQTLEKRRQALVNAFSGGDPAIEQSLKRMWTEQGDKLAATFGYDPKVLEYMAGVAEAAKGSACTRAVAGVWPGRKVAPRPAP